MEPVRIKLYGLFSMTRRRYVTQLIVAVFVVVLYISFWWLVWPGMRAQLEGIPDPAAARVVAVFDAIPYILLGVGLLQAIEAVFVLRMFRARDAQQQPQAPPAQDASPPAG